MSTRIQRRRTKGWRLPPGAIYVGRPSKWGNPYQRHGYEEWYFPEQIPALMVADFRHGCIERAFVTDMPPYPTIEEIRTELGGHDLVCWCPLDQPCHADVLLELAREGAA